MTTSVGRTRSVGRVVPSIQAYEGAGFLVHRPFPTQALSAVDPFLLLDEMGPMDLGPDEAKGAPDHPHRGFETVTYMLAGSMEHRDSQGNSGSLNPGDVQWMTAGAGVVHSEMPTAALLERGGRMHGFQLWVNLPCRDKLMVPRYQEVPGRWIPEATSADGLVKVRVIAGEALGARAVIETRTPIIYLHFMLQPGGSVVQAVPAGMNAFAFVFRGEGLFGTQRTKAATHQAVLFGDDGDSIAIEAPRELAAPLEALVIAGQPLKEPIVRYGPFVMNTAQEIREAIEDYNGGRMGRIPAEIKRP